MMSTVSRQFFARYRSLLNRHEFTWRWALNFVRSLRQHFQNCFPRESSFPLLRRDGIVLGHAETLLDAEGLSLLGQVERFLLCKLEDDAVRSILAGNVPATRKNYRTHLLGNEFDIDSPLIQLAVNERVVSIVNAYMGMYSYLRAVVAWLDVPTPGEAIETQLWHRDSDDRRNVKVFIYLNDVGTENGPFCFIPRTHPLGNLKLLLSGARIGDSEMAAAISRDQWKVCTGSSRTMVFVDTCVYHKGLKPEKGHRILLQFHFTSGSSVCPRSFTLYGSPSRKLSEIQRYALSY